MAVGMFLLYRATNVIMLYGFVMFYGFGYGSLAPVTPYLNSDRFGRQVLGVGHRDHQRAVGIAADGDAEIPLGGAVVEACRDGVVGPVVVEPGTRPTAVFGADGGLSGSASCNTFNNTYQVDGEQISFGPAASTMMACDTGMDQEAAYFSALEAAATYTIEGGQLKIFDGTGTNNLVYDAAVVGQVVGEAASVGTVERHRIDVPSVHRPQ